MNPLNNADLCRIDPTPPFLWPCGTLEQYFLALAKYLKHLNSVDEAAIDQWLDWLSQFKIYAVNGTAHTITSANTQHQIRASFLEIIFNALHQKGFRRLEDYCYDQAAKRGLNL